MAHLSASILKIQNLCKEFPGGTVAVDGVDLSLSPGEIYVLLGENGAGKSTTIHLILNLIEPTAGTIKVAGCDMVREPMLGKRHLSYVSENVMLYGDLTALENLSFFYSLGRGGKLPREKAHEVLAGAGLPREAHTRRLRTFSKGMRQKTGLAIAMAKDAELMLMDEPTSGLDPKSAAEIIAVIKELAERGKAILMTTHDIFRAMMLPGRVGIMQKGKIVFEKPTTELQGENLEKLYLELVGAED